MPRKISAWSELSFARTLMLRQIAFLTVTILLSGLILAQTTTTLVPTSYVTTAGNASSQPVATSIDLLDESGTTNTFSKYVEFNTNLNAVYAGYQLFTLPTSIAPSSVTGIQVKVNYQGPATATQTWTWQLFNWSTNSYVTVGTNAGAPAWGSWTILTFNATGTLANYVRTSDGQIKVQVVSNNASDAADIDYEAVLVTYSSGSLTISTTSLPSGTVGTAYSATLAATGGTTPYTWSLTAGTLPAGVTLSSAGVFSGTPTASGSFPITVQVTDSTTPTHLTKSANFTLTIASTTLTISTTSLPSGTVGTAYSATLAATGGTTPYAWSLTAGTLPAGITLSSAGVFSGTPTASGSFPIAVMVTDSTTPTHQTKSASFTLTVNPASGGTAFYVAPAASGGSDSNTGTLASPWLTITHAISAAGGPGVTINLRAGTYHERVVINKSGSSAGGNFTIQNYNGEAAIVDGTGVTIGNDGTYAYGLVDIQDQSYLTVSGLEITNFKTTNDSVTPAGIHVQNSAAASTNIQLLNNHIHAIWNTGVSTKHDGSCTGSFPNAFGLVAAGTSGTLPLSNLTISGNELNDLRTGCSESMTVNGNMQNFTISNNLVHDNSNIGIAALGGEGVASGYSQYNGSPNDQARNGTIRGNSVHAIHSGSLGASGVYGTACFCADGIYLDGSAGITVERNTVYDVDLGIEVTGEGAAQNTTNNIVRDNLFYSNTVVGISIGGQGTPGGSSNSTVVNNTLFKNGTNMSVALGEFATGTKLTGTNVFKNNIAYAGPSGVVVNAVTTTGVSAGYNMYFGGTSPFTETNSINADPLFVNTTTPDLHVSSGSLAVNAGTNLGAAVVGTQDVAGNPRVQGANIDIGAYEQ